MAVSLVLSILQTFFFEKGVSYRLTVDSLLQPPQRKEKKSACLRGTAKFQHELPDALLDSRFWTSESGFEGLKFKYFV